MFDIENKTFSELLTQFQQDPKIVAAGPISRFRQIRYTDETMSLDQKTELLNWMARFNHYENLGKAGMCKNYLQKLEEVKAAKKALVQAESDLRMVESFFHSFDFPEIFSFVNDGCTYTVRLAVEDHSGVTDLSISELIS
jgi:hypothetical protein